MGNPNWRSFVEELGKATCESRKIPELILDHLNPPIYARDELRKLCYMCDFCCEPRVDQCCICDKSVCDEHGLELKLHYVWHVCVECQKKGYDEEDIKEKDQDLYEYMVEQGDFEEEAETPSVPVA
jgi:hypothetical protein